MQWQITIKILSKINMVNREYCLGWDVSGSRCLDETTPRCSKRLHTEFLDGKASSRVIQQSWIVSSSFPTPIRSSISRLHYYLTWLSPVAISPVIDPALYETSYSHHVIDLMETHKFAHVRGDVNLFSCLLIKHLVYGVFFYIYYKFYSVN